MKIDINKKYRTVSAKWPVTIVSTEGPYPGFPVVGYAHSPSTNVPLLCHWSEVGGYPANTHLDLIEVREPREGFVSVVTEATFERAYGLGDPVGTFVTHRPGDEEDGFEVIRVREIID
jgi:hypothetical protein